MRAARDREIRYITIMHPNIHHDNKDPAIIEDLYGAARWTDIHVTHLVANIFTVGPDGSSAPGLWVTLDEIKDAAVVAREHSEAIQSRDVDLLSVATAALRAMRTRGPPRPPLAPIPSVAAAPAMPGAVMDMSQPRHSTSRQHQQQIQHRLAQQQTARYDRDVEQQYDSALRTTCKSSDWIQVHQSGTSKKMLKTGTLLLVFAVEPLCSQSNPTECWHACASF